MKKYAKMLGLAAVAALALMAFVGTTGAAASAKVCSTSGTGAACEGTHGSELTTQLVTATTVTTAEPKQDATLTSGFITVTCDSHIEVHVLHGGTLSFTSITFSLCTSNLGSCSGASTTASSSNPYAGTAVATGGGNGRLEVTSEVKGSFTCAGTTCVYSAPNAGTKGEIVGTGGETAKVTATKVPLTKTTGSGALCSSTANWDGSYTVTTPDSLWLT